MGSFLLHVGSGSGTQVSALCRCLYIDSPEDIFDTVDTYIKKQNKKNLPFVETKWCMFGRTLAATDSGTEIMA